MTKLEAIAAEYEAAVSEGLGLAAAWKRLDDQIEHLKRERSAVFDRIQAQHTKACDIRQRAVLMMANVGSMSELDDWRYPAAARKREEQP